MPSAESTAAASVPPEIDASTEGIAREYQDADAFLISSDGAADHRVDVAVSAALERR